MSSMCSLSCLAFLFLHTTFVFLSFFSSPELDASLSDSYCLMTCQPSLYLSVILIGFCLICIKFYFTDQSRSLFACCLDVSCLNLVENAIQFGIQFELFLISLKVDSTVSLSIFCLVSVCFPLTSS